MDRFEDAPTDPTVPEPDRISPADRLRARAAATDRAERFATRMQEVQQLRARRRRVRRLLRVGWAVLFSGIGALFPVVAAAVVGAADPTGQQLLLGAVVGAALGAAGPSLRHALARRRGAHAWDAYQERYVLLGDPSAEVRDADRPRPASGGGPSLRPPRR